MGIAGLRSFQVGEASTFLWPGEPRSSRDQGGSPEPLGLLLLLCRPVPGSVCPAALLALPGRLAPVGSLGGVQLIGGHFHWAHPR